MFEMLIAKEMLSAGLTDRQVRRAIMRARLLAALCRVENEAYKTVERAKDYDYEPMQQIEAMLTAN